VKKSILGIALTAMVMMAVFTACEGPAGPQGEQGAQGEQGTQGDPGVSIVWQGEHASAPAYPQANWAYFNTTSGNAYIWTGSAWYRLSQGGTTGADGADGTDGYDGTDGVGINWLGKVAAGEKPGDAGLNYVLHYLYSGNTYIFDGEEWRVMLPGTTVQTPAETAVTGITLSHTGTLGMIRGETRVIYATVTPATAVFQWVEWTADNDHVTITRTPRAGVLTGPETAISIRANTLGTTTITATAMGSGPVELRATITVEISANLITVDVYDDVTMDMMRIAPGTFTMGQTDLMAEWGDWIGTTEHQVTLTRGFYMGIHPVTREQFYAVMGTDPSTSGGTLAYGEEQERRPVETVNWYHAIAFANRLSIMRGLDPVYYVDGVNWETLTFSEVPTTNDATWNAVTVNWDADGFRLATEAEWEYAARAGTTTQWSFGDTDADIDNYAWTERNSDGRTHEVGRLDPNAWGLYDMHGNVWEWVWDWFGAFDPSAAIDPTGAVSGDFRVIRGGSWNVPPVSARSALRNFVYPDDRGLNLGFRVVRP